VGVLVIDKRQPWLPDDDELRLLLLMANQAAIAIEKARLHQQEVKAEALEQEVALGRQIQLSLLPKAPPVVSGWEFATWYQPARLVGGDFFDFFELPGRPHRLGIVIADVAGKGVPAALFMALSRTLIRGAAMTGDTPAAVLAQANRALRDDSRSDLFLTVFYGVLYTESGHLVYANAGHNRPLWLRSGTSQIEELAAPGIALGVVQDMELEERGIDMAGGDVVVAYTDGVTEAMDANNGLFDHGRLHEAVLAQAGAGARQILDATVDAVQAFVSGATQSDDLTLVVFRRCP
jgi:sigma-B regulation protein RsbU (phosphoserine phosphatase)